LLTLASNNQEDSFSEEDPIVILLDQNFLVSEINASTAHTFFEKDKSELTHRPLLELLAERGLKTDAFENALVSVENHFFQRAKIYHTKLKKEFIVTIVKIELNGKRAYAINIFICSSNAYNDLKAYMDSIINNLPGAVYWKDKEGQYLGCNKFVARMAGYNKPSDMIGKTDYDLCWKEFADDWRQRDLNVLKEGQTIVCEEKVRLADGSIITELTFKTPLRNKNGDIVGIIGTSLDITERKEMEEQLKISKEQAEAANRAKTEFITNMSHDVRTPISGVLGASDILEHEGDSARDREFGHLIHASAARLMELLDDILEMISADEVSESSLKLSTFNLRARLDFIKDLLTPNAVQSDIELNFNLANDVPTFLISDRIKIDRILVNIVSNALKFTHMGSINIAVELLEYKNDRVSLLFTIKDTGIGISADQLDKIFDRFYRISPSYHNKYRGHGIGLFIVQKYVTILGGNIAVQSELNKGTTFKITLPFKIGNASEADDSPEESTAFDNLVAVTHKSYNTATFPPSQKLPEDQEKLSSRKVLVVEDDAVARRVVRVVLQRGNFAVIDVETAEQGIWEIMNNDYSLIITDLGLPGMDGQQFAQMIRAWEKFTGRDRLPIIGLSAHGSNLQNAAQAAGMDLLLSKPLSDEKVQAIDVRFFSPVIQQVLEKERETPDGETTALGYQLPETEQELFALNHFPLLDEEEGINAVGSVEMLQELLTMLVEQTFPDELPLLKNAYAENDWSTVQAIAHKLKGGALYVGTIRLRYACQYTERYRLAGHTKLLEPLYQQLLEVINETSEHITDWLNARV
jgi:PAS domain S-box-containing protein